MDLIYDSSSDSSSPHSGAKSVKHKYYQKRDDSATTWKPISGTGTESSDLSGHLKYSASSTTPSPSLTSFCEGAGQHSNRKRKATSHELRVFLKSKRQAASSNDSADGDGDDDDCSKRRRSRKLSSSSSSSSSSSESELSSQKSSHNPINAFIVPRRKRKLASFAQEEGNEDTEIGYNPPMAKRQQLATVTAPVANDSITKHYLESEEEDDSSLSSSSSSSLNTTNEGRSPEKKCCPVQYDHNDNDDDDGDESDFGNNNDKAVLSHGLGPNNYTDEGSESDNVDDDEEIISGTATTSPSASNSSCTSNGSSQERGECTPGAELPMHSTNTTTTIRPKVKTFDEYMATKYACMSPDIETDDEEFPVTEQMRSCPLPALSWANAADVWKLMCKKDEQSACFRCSSMMDRHPGLQPRMRAILLDWLIEVCEVYKLHRETYYLAMDFLDRYLVVVKQIQKTHLQLIGITCLFVAAKAEEIYPPKISEFAYVTDGACTEIEILQQEKLVLQSLDWKISSVTAMGWLGVFMQLNVNNHTPASLTKIASAARRSETNDAFIYPQFSALEFVQTAQLLDLCSLDVGINNYPYSVIAAAALSHTFDPKIAMKCSSLDWPIIEPCAIWMEPFFQVISEAAVFLPINEKEDESVNHKYGLAHVCPNMNTNDACIIQTHTTNMDMFDQVLLLQQQKYADKMKQEASPGTGLICPEGLLTPPASSHKPLEEVGGDAYYDNGNGSSHHQQSSMPSSSALTSGNTTVVMIQPQEAAITVQVANQNSSTDNTATTITTSSTTSCSSSSCKNSKCNTNECQPPE